jgi:hypothetical protein
VPLERPRRELFAERLFEFGFGDRNALPVVFNGDGNRFEVFGARQNSGSSAAFFDIETVDAFAFIALVPVIDGLLTKPKKSAMS